MTLKRTLYRNFSTKPVLVFIHGFSKRTFQPLNHAIDYFRSHGYLVIVQNLFNPDDETDDNPQDWMANATKLVEEALEIKQEVVLIGFSMGGVIASELASHYPTKMLVLLAPAFEYVTLKAVRETISKHIPKKTNGIDFKKDKLPESFVEAFKDLVSLYKSSVSNVVCKTIIFHGRNDEKIPVRSSEYGYNHLASVDKKLFLLAHANHNLMEDKLYYQDILAIIHQNLRQIENKPF